MQIRIEFSDIPNVLSDKWIQGIQTTPTTCFCKESPVPQIEVQNRKEKSFVVFLSGNMLVEQSFHHIAIE